MEKAFLFLFNDLTYKNDFNMIRISYFRKSLSFLIAFIALFMIDGCKDNILTPHSNNFEVSTLSSPNLSDVPPVMTIDSIKMLISDIKLTIAGNHDSLEFKTGPFMLRLDPNFSVITFSSGFIPEGSYENIKFEVHKPSNEEVTDTIFTNGGKYSVFVYGSYNTEPFTYRSSNSAKLQLNFYYPAFVSDSGTTNITLVVKPYFWFFNGSNYIDPRVPTNWSQIDYGIKNNFYAIKDNNHDGIGETN